jgi:hypothetical protein
MDSKVDPIKIENPNFIIAAYCFLFIHLFFSSTFKNLFLFLLNP